jgi:biotin carboxyl carrier protein
MPGQVVAVVAATGATVDAGATILTIEAMKMEHAVAAPIAGRLTDLHVRAGDQVQRGQLLAVVEP